MERTSMKVHQTRLRPDATPGHGSDGTHPAATTTAFGAPNVKKTRNFSEMFGDAAMQTARLHKGMTTTTTTTTNNTIKISTPTGTHLSTTLKPVAGSSTKDDDDETLASTSSSAIAARQLPKGSATTTVLTAVRPSTNGTPSPPHEITANHIQVSDSDINSHRLKSSGKLLVKQTSFIANETTAVPTAILVAKAARKSLTNATSTSLTTTMPIEQQATNKSLFKANSETKLRVDSSTNSSQPPGTAGGPAPPAPAPAPAPVATAPAPASALNKPPIIKSSLRTLFSEKKQVSFSDLTGKIHESTTGSLSNPPGPPASAPPETDSTTKKPSSRLLDDTKRQEFWMDFKKAEEVAAAGDPQRRTSLTDSETDESSAASHRTSTVGPLMSSNGAWSNGGAGGGGVGAGGGGGAASPTDSRLDNLLLNLQNELTSLRAEKARSMSLYPGSPQTNRQLSPDPLASPTSMMSSSPSRQRNRSQSTYYQSDVVDAAAGLNDTTMTAMTATTATTATTTNTAQSKMEAELERRSRMAASDKETIRVLQQKVQFLDNLQRQNQFLKEENQKHMMQELSAQELLKTLREKLLLTEKSEDQLKLQTKQLMQQNQTLQADLLEKIASETSRIQKIASLNTDKNRLTDQLQKLELQSSQQADTYRKGMHLRILGALLARKERHVLHSALTTWKWFNAHVLVRHEKALDKLCRVLHKHRWRHKLVAWHRLRTNHLKHHLEQQHATLVTTMQHSDHAKRLLGLQTLVLQLHGIFRRMQRAQLRKSFERLKQSGRDTRLIKSNLRHGLAKWESLMRNKRQWDKAKGFLIWKFFVESDFMRERMRERDELERELNESKQWIVTLTKAKARAEDQLDALDDDKTTLMEQLEENKTELRMAKHGFVVIACLKVQEMQFLRGIFQEWKLATQLALQEHGLEHAQHELALQLDEKTKYAASLDDYNRVLRNDLERYQFFSQDKRITVDVLTKKILREEERFKQLEEKQVLVEEKNLLLRDQLASLVEWEGIDLPLPLLSWSKDLALSKIRELFLLHAEVVSGTGTGTGRGTTTTTNTATGLLHHQHQQQDSSQPGTAAAQTYRVPFDALVRMIHLSRTTTAASSNYKDKLLQSLHRHFPHGADRGVDFTEFIAGMGTFLNDVFDDAPDRNAQIKTFWKSLFNVFVTHHHASSSSCSSCLSSSSSSSACCCGGSSRAGKGKTCGGDFAVVGSPKSSWAGKLSDDILQNQEKLLAVLEHETAVVERAVMEKGASMKHTYLPSDAMDMDASSSTSCSTSTYGAAYGNNNGHGDLSSNELSARYMIWNTVEWLDLAQVRDIYLANQVPILQVFTRHSSHEFKRCRFTNLVDLLLELNLLPHVVSKERAFVFFQRLKDVDEQVDFNNFLRFLGLCALQLYENALQQQQQQQQQQQHAQGQDDRSIREILACFFTKVGFMPAPATADAAADAAAAADGSGSGCCICVGTQVESILWPLFEYYASLNDHRDPTDKRMAMNGTSFMKFMSEIAQDHAPNYQHYETIFRRVMSMMESHEEFSTTGSLALAQLHFDGFCRAIALIQREKNAFGTYTDDGEAIRHWMQETQ